jgi:hypothetical protein
MFLKKSLLALSACATTLAMSSAVQAATVTVSSITPTANITYPVGGIPMDGSFPVQSSDWNASSNASWTSNSESLLFTFDGAYSLTGVNVSFDNNDSYRIYVSTNGTDWTKLTTAYSFFGEQNWGMDTLSTVASSSEYVEDFSFTPTAANIRYAKIVAFDGDNQNAVGGVQFLGTAAPVPEPETYAMMLAGLGALGFMSKRRKAS